MLLACGFFIPVLTTYVHTGLVPNFPTLIICGFAAIAALQAFFSGLILNTIGQKNRQDFELNLYHAMRNELHEKEEELHD